MEYTCTVQCTNTPINPFIHIQKTCIETHRSLPLCEQRTKQNSKLCTILRLFLAHSFLFDNFRVLIVFGMPYSLGSNESSTERDDDVDGSDGDDGNAYIWNMVCRWAGFYCSRHSATTLSILQIHGRTSVCVSFTSSKRNKTERSDEKRKKTFIHVTSTHTRTHEYSRRATF